MAQTVAFPGAEGFGRFATGGRGGAVYHVTTLEDNTSAGSFRYACTRSGARTIVFDVSGTIQLTSQLKLSSGNVTIAGQTAPGDGICIAGYPFVIAADNVIIRFMRFRLGNENVAYHEGDGLGGMDRSNLMIDHCSVSWSIDECLSVYGSKNITVQWCIAAQSLKNAGHSKGAHGYGGNWGGAGATYHHNLLAHHESRVPRLGPRPGTQTDERMDLRNNVMYNWAGNGCYGGEGMNVNIVNNYYKPGPATLTRSSGIQKRIAAPGIRTVDYCLNKTTIATNYNSVAGTSLTSSNISGSHSGGKYYVTCGTTKYEINMTDNTIDVDGTPVTIAWNEWKAMLHVWCKLYVDGNYNPNFPAMNEFTDGISAQIDKTGNDGTYPGDDAIKLSTPITYSDVTTHSAKTAFERVLDYAGASLHRDALDEIIVNDTRNGVASCTASGNLAGIINTQDDVKYADGSTGWPKLESIDAPVDTDGDGMPDAWETENGLNPNDASDGKTVGDDGYTNLEKYLNSLVAHIMEAGNAGGVVLGDNEIFTGTGEPEPVEYTLSSATATCTTADTEWTFNNGCVITNPSGKLYATAQNSTIKYSKGVEFTINLPDNAQISSVTFTGYGNEDDVDCYLGNLNGTDYLETDYVFPDRKEENATTSMKSYTIDLPTPVVNALTFTVKQAQAAFLINLKGTVTTAIHGVVVSDKAKTDNRIYTLQGVEVNAATTPGIYIRNGKKFVVR
ncbi:MAG: pectate lyase [Prevotella sp.]